MNRLDDARTALHNALKGLLPEGHVTKYVPAQIVAPCVWIESATLGPESRGTNSVVLVANFPIVGVVDGGQDAQTLGTDDLTALVWDCVETVPGANAQLAEPATLDVGGPQLRAITVTAAVTLRGRGLCLPDNATPEVTHE